MKLGGHKVAQWVKVYVPRLIEFSIEATRGEKREPILQDVNGASKPTPHTCVSEIKKTSWVILTREMSVEHQETWVEPRT